MPVHELRTPTNGTGDGNLLVAIDLPDGEFLFDTDSFPGRCWEQPVAGPRMPGGLGEVEYYLDGRFWGFGVWPNVKRVG